MTPTARTLKWLREDGWTAEVVERWNPHAKIRQDLFGFIDIIGFRGSETLGVQATSTSNQAARVAKIAESEIAKAWVAGGRLLFVVGWRKYKKPRDGKWWVATVTEIRA